MKILFLLCFLILIVQPYRIFLEPNSKVCFFENMDAGNVFGINFEVIPLAGTHSTVDLEVYLPDGNLAIQNKDEQFGTYHFKVPTDGPHYYCFTPKSQVKLNFNVLGGHPADSHHGHTSSSSNTTSLEQSLEQLAIGLQAVHEEHEYILLREKIHYQTANSTNSRVLWWALFEYLMLAGVCYWQIWYLKRFFEVKKSI